jgi:transcriptional antiterminator RfaH
MTPYWCCAQTAPQQESAAQHFLKLRGFESYCPRLRVARHRHGRKIELRPPLFVSYLFIRIVSGWWDARWCPYVSRVILNGTQPAIVPAAVIDEIRGREKNGLIELAPPALLRRGARVRILHGPFAGHLAIFADMKPRQRVEVLLRLLGGQQRVTMAKEDVETLIS